MLSRTEVTWCFHQSQLDVPSHGDEFVHGFPASHSLTISWGSKYEDSRVGCLFPQVPWDQVLGNTKNQYTLVVGTTGDPSVILVDMTVK